MPRFIVHGDLSTSLDGSAPMDCLVNADIVADAEAIMRRCRAFHDAQPHGAEALIVTLLRVAPPGLRHFAIHQANATLWAFTRQAALEWAPRRIRVNAIGLGVSPAGPFESTEPSGRAASDGPAFAAVTADILRSIRAMVAWPSMTGQIIRLGA